MRLVAIAGVTLALACGMTAQAETPAKSTDTAVVIPNATRDGEAVRLKFQGETVTAETLDGEPVSAGELVITVPGLRSDGDPAQRQQGPLVSPRGAINPGVGTNVALPASSNRQPTHSGLF